MYEDIEYTSIHDIKTESKFCFDGSKMKNTNALWLSLLLLIIPCSAWSQTTELYVETFEPEPTQKTAILNIATSEVLPSGIPSVGVFTHFVDDAAQLRRENSDEIVRLLDDQLKTEFSFGMGFFDFLDFGATVPVTVYQTGESLLQYNNNPDSVSSFSFADPRVSLKASFIPDRLGGLGLAVKGTTYIPLGNREFHTDGDFRFEPELIIDWANDDFKIALNGAYQIRSEKILLNVGSDDVLKLAAGAQFSFLDPVSVFATFNAGISLTDGRDPDDLTIVTSNDFGNPMEVDGGFRFDIEGDWTVNIGGGMGLSKGLGSPDFRVFGGIEHVAFPTGLGAGSLGTGAGTGGDSGGDNVELEGTRDSDGDGIMDADDKCPNETEDIDTFQDEDGCPDPDNDNDGVLDAEDECPGLTGILEKQGCPFVDSDKDGIDDDSDSCPQKPEDKDGFEDDDGCPDLDNDKDGIPDVKDKCPMEKETINGEDDEDGCPDKSESKVRVTEDRIEIFEKVYFDSNRSKIQKRSLNILRQVRSIMRANPRIKVIQVEGHTDNQGSAESNLSLSQRRAEAVIKFLIDSGIEKSRLKPKGYGEARPVADNKDKTGRSENRRVEFFILDIEAKK